MDEKQVQSLDEKMDSFLDQATTKPEAVTEPEAKEPEASVEATPAEVSKDTETADTDKAYEDKLAKIKEILGDDEQAIDAYIKSKGFHKNPAWQKLIEKTKNPVIPPEVSKEIETVKQVVSDPEFIRFRMQKEGYKDEAIDRYLQSKGYQVTPKQEDDISLISRTLNMQPEDIPAEYKPIISDVAKIAEIKFKHMMETFFPEKLGPLSEKVDSVYNETMANKLLSDMESKVKKDGDLSFEEDVAPLLNKYIDENPQAKMNDVQSYFREIYPELRIERIKLGKRQEKRAESKEQVVTGKKVPLATGKPPVKTGDRDKDMDAFLDFIGYKE